MPHRSPHQQGTTYIDVLGILELCDKFNSDSHVREQVHTPDLQRPEKSTPPQCALPISADWRLK